MGAYMGIIGYVLKAVGIGLDGMDSKTMLKQQEKMTLLNFQIQEDHFNQQRQTASMQQQINQQIASNEKAALERNAAVLEQQAQVVGTVGRQNARQTRDEYARMLSAIRAKGAKSNIVGDFGSWGQMQEELTKQGQSAVERQAYGTENEMRSLFREADNQRAEGHNAMLSIVDAQARGGAAKMQAQNALTQANFHLAKEMQVINAQKRSTWQQVLQGVMELFNTNSYGGGGGSGGQKAQTTPRTSYANASYLT